jgi:hypothetical protein
LVGTWNSISLRSKHDEKGQSTCTPRPKPMLLSSNVGIDKPKTKICSKTVGCTTLKNFLMQSNKNKVQARQRLNGSRGKGGISSMKGFGFSIAKLNI